MKIAVKVTIQPSDLMLINRAIAHDAIPKDKSFFIDSDGKYVPYLKRKPSIMTARDTLRDLELSASKLLRSLSVSEAKSIRNSHATVQKKRDRHLNVIVDIVSKHSTHEELKQFAPNLLNLI